MEKKPRITSVDVLAFDKSPCPFITKTHSKLRIQRSFFKLIMGIFRSIQNINQPKVKLLSSLP
jgi:hypothetical protein